MQYFVFVCVCTAFWTSTVGGQFTNSAFLDETGDYVVQWFFDETTITFQLTVKTTGYVGFGLSQNGKMAGSDIVIGWVDSEGKAILSDRHGTGNMMPPIDAEQDWELISGSENATHTVLRIKRDLILCDKDDRKIKGETARVIWSYHSDDPVSAESIMMHQQYGSKSVLLLTYNSEEQELPNDIFTETFTFDKVPISSTRTTYMCGTFELTQRMLSKKHHAIKIGPDIEPGHRGLVHHILVYACYHDMPNDTVGVSHECHSRNMPGNWYACSTLLYGWAVGGMDLVMPGNVGFSYGEVNDPVIIKMEIHYDNPDELTNLTDSSGIRITLTSQIREYDAEMLEIGMLVDRNHFIPPYSDSFKSYGYCTQGCIDKALLEHPEGIKVLGGLLHTHLAGAQVFLHHYRKGEELPLMLGDANYDFNYQELRMFKDDVIVKPGDSLSLECVYDTSRRENITWAGLETMDEMCLAYLVYYPKINLNSCTSLPIAHTFLPKSEITGNNWMLDILSKDWTSKALRDRLQAAAIDTQYPQHSRCLMGRRDEYNIVYIPKVKKELETVDACTPTGQANLLQIQKCMAVFLATMLHFY